MAVRGGLATRLSSIVGDNRIHPRSSFRKIPKGGPKPVERHLGGGGGACV